MDNSKACQHCGDPTHTGLVFLSNQTVIFLREPPASSVCPECPAQIKRGQHIPPVTMLCYQDRGGASMSEPAWRWLPQLEAEGQEQEE